MIARANKSGLDPSTARQNPHNELSLTAPQELYDVKIERKGPFHLTDDSPTLEALFRNDAELGKELIMFARLEMLFTGELVVVRALIILREFRISYGAVKRSPR